MRSSGARAVLAGLFALLVLAPGAGAQGTCPPGPGDTCVTVGSPPTPFSQNKQNEPAVAIDQGETARNSGAASQVLAAGSNDEIDMEACNAGPDNDCPFTDGVGVSGIYFSFNGGASWTQPTYTGLSGRNCEGVPGDGDPPCTATRGPIGTLPKYAEHNLVSDGDPALAFGPRPTAGGGFSYAGGSRLYYANLTSAVPGTAPFKGAEAIAVSHTDNPRAAAGGGATGAAAWSDPVIASRQSGAQFSDKEQIWADNAQSSKFFGNVYVCYAAFRGNGNGFTNQPLAVITSRDGGNSWTQKQVTPAANNVNGKNGFGRSGCTVRTDSMGVVYVFVYQFAVDPAGAAPGQIQMIKSFDGGKTFTRPQFLFTAYDTCNKVEPSIGRCVEDGVGGARSDLSPVPSADIANGAPSGAGATNRIVMSWVDGRTLNAETVQYSSSTNGGSQWEPPRAVQQPGDRGYYSAPSVSPDGRDVYLVYNAFTTPFQTTTATPRNLVGVVLHADAPVTGATGPFSLTHRGLNGDPRGSSQNDLAAEFLGDYVYSAATNSYGTAVWNDMRNGADCPAIDQYRQDLHDEAVATGRQTAEAEEPRGEEERGNHSSKTQEEEAEAPDVQARCPANFGNSDIYGGSFADPSAP
jgi:hypothetical protein